jgi:hypothetical protein
MRSRVWPARQVAFRVFRSEKRFSGIPAREAYLYVLCAPGDNQYLVEWEVREIARSVAYPVRPVINANVLAALAFLAAVPVYSLSCCCSCMQHSSLVRC